ncbi:DUF5610 domain-containing protein [Fibrobacterota bacterium]
MQTELQPVGHEVLSRGSGGNYLQNGTSGKNSVDDYDFQDIGVDRPRYLYSVEGYNYQREELNLKYQNQDGDFFELSYRSESYKAFSASAPVSDEMGRKYFDEMLKQLKEYIMMQEQRILEIFFGDDKSAKVREPAESDPAAELGIPEYWNAENTSQRIVDFATSFFSMSGQEADEFGKTIIAAVKKGFEEANEILGNLPGAAGRLIADTQQLTLEKLDAWVAEHSEAEMALAA